MMKNYRKERSSSSSETPRIEAAFRRDDGKWCAWPSLCVSLFWHDKYWKYKIHTRTSIRTHSTLLSAFCTTPWVSGRRGKKPEPCAPMTRHCTSNSHHSHTQSEEIFAFDHTSFHTVFFVCCTISGGRCLKRTSESISRDWSHTTFMLFYRSRCMFHELCR